MKGKSSLGLMSTLQAVDLKMALILKLLFVVLGMGSF